MAGAPSQLSPLGLPWEELYVIPGGFIACAGPGTEAFVGEKTELFLLKQYEVSKECRAHEKLPQRARWGAMHERPLAGGMSTS